MTKFYYFSLLFLFCYAANAQNDVVIRGTVLDVNTQVPLELATVYFTTVKDSTVIEYATTDKNGFFRLSTKKYDKPVVLKVSYEGYQTFYEDQKGLSESKDFGKIYLFENINALDNVVIKSEAPPITIKKDTLEFNAASYKVRPDSNVETLLKQLPGVDVDSDGKVTVNGREVTQFLVNGKTFFDKDGAIALKNLPAEIIKKIQVSDFKTKKEELSKQESTSDYSSINITIDEKKNKGYFGKILGGYGSDDRYESSLILNFFNNKQKISVLASSNNINSTGFAMDEVFDNMGGGRNAKSGSSSTGAKGITQSNLAGLNYSDDWTEKLSAMGSYNFTNSVNKNDSKSDQTSFLPDGDILTSAESTSKNESTGNKANVELEYKIDPTMRLVVAPKISESHSNSNSSSSSFSEDENGQSLNKSTSKSYGESKNTSFSNAINFNKTFKKKSRNLSFVFTNNNTNSDSDGLNFSQTTFYQGDKPNEDRNQNNKKTSSNDAYSADIEYTEPVTDSLRIRFGSDFDWASTMNDEKTFNFDPTTQAYTDLNAGLSNYTTSKQNSISPKVGLTLQKSKFTINLNSRTAIVDFDNHSLYLNNVTDLDKKYLLPFGDFQIRYKFSRSKNLTFKYDYSNTLPSSTQLMPVLDKSNPLNTIVGNPNLKPIEKSSANFNFKNYDFRTRSGYNFYIKGDYYNNDVVTTSVYDTISGARNTTYANISGTYTASIGGNWNQSLKMDAHVLRYGFGLNSSYAYDKGFTNAVIYTAKSTAITPKINFTYEYGDLLIISPTYSLSFNDTKYEGAGKPSSNVIHRINLQTTTYWPENLIFGNDFGYTYNSNISSNFKKDFYLWNTSLSYGFFDKKIYAKVKVYDLLNQNQSATRTISATSIRDEENTVLKRYIMFSLSYKIGNFSGSEKGKGKKRRQREE
jgi:hypothetical protein